MCKAIRTIGWLCGVLAFAGVQQALAICPDCQVPVNDAGVGISLQIRNNGGVAQASYAECETMKISVVLSFLGCPNSAFQGGTISIVTPDGVTNNVTGGGVGLIGDPNLGNCDGVTPQLSRSFGPVTYVVNSADIVGGNVSFAGVYANGTAFTGPGTDTGTAQANISQGVPVTLCPDDGNVCNGAESCDPALVYGINDSRLGGCVNGTPLSCPDDSNVCNGPERCDPILGCITGPPLDCPSDSNVCNGPETCDPILGCVSGPPLDCPSDNNVCNGPETCDPIQGCVSGPPLTCVDTDPCTTDTCDPIAGCQFTPIPDCGGQGCTPGFWKANADNKEANAWPVSPDALVSSVFTIPGCISSSYGNLTLRQALSLKGGSSLNGAAEILLRIGTGAYLNALSDCVNYAQSAADVVTDVNAALASCNRGTILSLASDLDFQNNAGCPLNQQGDCSNPD